jgi:hypothetical protein
MTSEEKGAAERDARPDADAPRCHETAVAGVLRCEWPPHRGRIHRCGEFTWETGIDESEAGA